MIYLNLILMLIVILVAAEIFTNALEHLGKKLEISEGVTGSIFAAVGTALPETSIPLIAILGTHQQNQSSVHDIGIGAILGAPLMLSTLAFTIMALAVIKKRGFAGSIKPEKKRDIERFKLFFICLPIGYCLIICASSKSDGKVFNFFCDGICLYCVFIQDF